MTRRGRKFVMDRYIVEFLAMTALTAVGRVFALIVVCEDECLSSLHELDIAVYNR